MSTTALIRRPSSRLDEGIVSHIEREPVDVARAVEQWEAYGEALRGSGWRTVEVPPADDSPDSVFVEDTMVVFGATVVISRPGMPTRQTETTAAEQTVSTFGYDVHRITPPGTLDGGDVLKVGDIMYVARGGRTNGEGIRQLRAVRSARRACHRRAGNEGVAPEDRRHGPAGRHDHRLAARPRRPRVLPAFHADA